MGKVHELRLFALLLDLVGRHGRRGAAEVLGVSYHAVARPSSSGRLTGRVSAALARHLLEGGGAAASRRAERFADLERRVEALEVARAGAPEAASSWTS